MERGFVESVVKSLAAKVPDTRKDTDYVGKDGLLYCGNCRQRKEKLLMLDGGKKEVKVRCLCSCEKAIRDKQVQEDSRREAEQAIKRMKAASLMDKKLEEARFENFIINDDNKRQFRICQRYTDNFDEMCENNQGLSFHGDVGTGKSYAAACIANALLDKGVSVIMTSFVRILDMIENREESEDIINRVTSAGLVIFDDLGAERGTAYSLEKIYNVINSRYLKKKPMIITTNLTLNAMINETDERYTKIYDRIFEVCYPVNWTGMSWRKRKAFDRFGEMRKLLEDD